MSDPERNKRILQHVLSQVPEGHKGPVVVDIPDEPGKDIVLVVDGKKTRFPPSTFEDQPPKIG